LADAAKNAHAAGASIEAIGEQIQRTDTDKSGPS
jgi:hypothetical protein